jgi:carboxypeptidase C (cathepsin A)
VVDYSHNMSFVTVHGSGHMVPQFRPQAALHLLKTVFVALDVEVILKPPCISSVY